MKKTVAALAVIMMAMAALPSCSTAGRVAASEEITDHETIDSILEEHFPEIYRASEAGVVHVDKIIKSVNRKGHIKYKVEYDYHPHRLRLTQDSLSEEKEPGGPTQRDAVGVAYRAIRAILNRAVRLHVADGAIRTVLHSAVRLDIAHRAVGTVLHLAVRLNVSYGAVRAVLDRAV